MAVVPDGIESCPLDKLADLVASSPRFQTWVGEISEAAAKAHVYIGNLSEDETDISAARPFAVVWHRFAANTVNRMGGFGFGTLAVHFEAAVTETTQRDALYEFTNEVGHVVREMQRESRGGGRLCVPSISALGPPQRSMRTEQEDYYWQEFEIVYGLVT